MTTPPRPPEQVDIVDLTQTEGDPTEQAQVEVVFEKKTSLSFKLMVAKYFVLETTLDESESNLQTAALLHFAVIMIVVGGIIALVHVLSENLWIALGSGAVILASAVLFVRTANHRREPRA
jgi:hypothetical protein